MNMQNFSQLVDQPQSVTTPEIDTDGLVCKQPNHTEIAPSNDETYVSEVDLVDPEDELKRDLQIFDREIDELNANPDDFFYGKGPAVHIGFDSEYLSSPDSKHNTYLSLQFYVVGEGGTFTKVIYPNGPLQSDRPSLYKTIVQLLQDSIDAGVIREWPKNIVLCGFFLRTDIAAFGDLQMFKTKLDTASGKVTTVGEDVHFVPEKPAGDSTSSFDGSNPLKSKLVVVKNITGVRRAVRIRFIDIGSHAAVGTSLSELGDLIGLPKLDLPDGYSIDKMDVLLKENKPAFEEYGLRDAEIAVRYFLKLESFAFEHAGESKLPATASGLAVKIFNAQLKESGIDFNATFGLHEKTTTYWNTAKGNVVTKKEKVPTAVRSIVEPFVTSCYHGGRNECYAFGPTAVGTWNDFDLAGAYTTGLVDLRHIDYENFWYTKDEHAFVGHVLGFALVEFEFPASTIYPCLPVEGDNGGLFYPLTGQSYCTAPEIEVALNMGCDLKIIHGLIIPWKESDERVFEKFTTSIRDLRRSFPKGSPYELYAKLIGNALYGKLAQGLKKKTVFDTHGMRSIELPHSTITNSIMAAHTTGLIRAVLSEQIARVPAGKTVVSATTDGFLTDAEQAELDQSGPMAQRYQALCERVAPNTPMLEMKHKVKQLIAMKTRGQITAMPFEGEKIVLAKAGVSPSVPASEHNDFMLDLFLNRQPGQKATSRPFTSIRDQWQKGYDVVRAVRKSTLNLEYDFKRKLYQPSVLQVGNLSHVALQSKPWMTIDEAERTRAVHSGWRRTRCLRSMNDWMDWAEHIEFTGVRDRMKAGGQKQSVRITKEGVVGLFRRQFFRAYTQQLAGLTKTMTYVEVAEWLTSKGYPTRIEELKNAKRAPFIQHLIPVSNRIDDFACVLLEQFPEMDLNKFYVQ